jgi:hypothetical protein
MIPRSGRRGGGRDRYECSGRVKHKNGCDQPSIRRELVDEPFVANLKQFYIDLEASERRADERDAAAFQSIREALRDAQAESLRLKSRTLEIKGDYMAGRIDAEEWRDLKASLAEAVDVADAREREATEQLQRAEAWAAAHKERLAGALAVKGSVAEAVERAPDLPALRNAIGQLFESVELIEWPGFGNAGKGHPSHLETPVTGCGYALLPHFRDAGAVQEGVGQIELPLISDHDTFFSRYCWW